MRNTIGNGRAADRESLTVGRDGSAFGLQPLEAEREPPAVGRESREAERRTVAVDVETKALGPERLALGREAFDVGRETLRFGRDRGVDGGVTLSWHGRRAHDDFTAAQRPFFEMEWRSLRDGGTIMGGTPMPRHFDRRGGTG